MGAEQNNSQSPEKIRKVIYTPAQVSTIGLAAVEQNAVYKRSGEGISIPIEGIGLEQNGRRPYFPPVGPGQTCTIIGQTSNFKSGFMELIEYTAAEQLHKRQLPNHIIVHISVEDLIEEMAYQMLARQAEENAGDLARGVVQDWDRLKAAATYIGTVPIYRLGDALCNSEEDLPLLYVSNMARAVRMLAQGEFLDFKPKIAGIFVDYLQAFPLDPSFRSANPDTQRRLQVRHDFYQLRRLAAEFACPLFVNVQARQHLEGASPPVMLPGVYDGEESAAIGQRTDRALSIWMPKTTSPVGTTIEKGNFTFTVAENHLMIKVVKQRGRLPAGRAWLCEVDFDTNRIHPMDG
jgi:hypothetical protein